MNTNTAKTFGAMAFTNGIKCAPCLDSNLMNMIVGREIGDKRTSKDMKAWIAGWTEANLSIKL